MAHYTSFTTTSSFAAAPTRPGLPAASPLRIAIAMAVAGLTCAPFASAQDTGVIGEVVVTAKRKFRPETSAAASKLELPIIETPQALTVLSSEFLDIARLNDTASLVAYTPGVEFLGTGDGTQANILARGFDVNRERSFRINGLSADSEVDLDYFAMDRVEIVRGPASSLYGEADYGATLNRVLKRPDGRSTATTSLEFGSYDFRRAQGDVQMRLGSSDVVGVRAVAAVQDSETFIDATQDDRVLFAPSLSLDFERTQLLFQGYYEQRDGDFSDGIPLIFDGDSYSLPRLPRERNYGADVFKIDSENMFLYAGMDHSFSDDLKLSLKTGYSRVEMNNIAGVLFNAGPSGDSLLSPFTEQKDKEDLSVDVALEKVFSMGGREQRVLVSADWRQNELFSPLRDRWPSVQRNIFVDGPLMNYPPPQQVQGEFTRNKQYFSGITAMTHLKPTERLSMLLGLRYSEIETNLRRFQPSRRRDETIDGAKDDELVPRAALIYQIAEGHNAYASYSEGIIFNATLLKLDGTVVNPEKGVQYELGFKGELADKRVTYGIAAFQIDRTDSASRVPLPPGAPPAFFNVGKQVHQGIELEMVGEPIPGLNIVASYAWLDVEIRESADPAEVGETPPASPKNSYSLFATYEILDGPLRSLTFGGGIVARSEREVDGFGSYQLPSFERFDVRASYDVTDALSVEVNATNVFDKDIYVSNYGAADFGISYAFPRTISGRVSYRW